MFGVKWVIHRHETHPVEVDNSTYLDVDKVVESCRARLPEMRRKHSNTPLRPRPSSRRVELLVNAIRPAKAVQSNPAFSFSYMLLAAPLAKLGRLEEAKPAAARVLELQPAFRYSRQLSGVDCVPALAASLSEALRATGLPE